MPNYELPVNITGEGGGLEQLIIYESTQVEPLAAGLLFFIFFIIFGSGYFIQERRGTRGHLSMWLAISGLITSFLSIVLFLYEGIVNLPTVVITIILSVVFTMWFLVDSF